MAQVVGKRLIGRLAPHSSVLFVCDVQEIFRHAIFQMPTVVRGTNALVSAAKALDVPVVVTTQYAARLGGTVSEINANLADAPHARMFDKTLFSMMTDEVRAHVESGLPGGRRPASVILCGIEGHVCVLQTCLDLLDLGYDVHVVADAVSSSTSFNRDVSLERMRQSGAFITSVESSIFQLAGDASTPTFKKTISPLIKEHLKHENGFDRTSKDASRL
ncbi:hypothetical protein PybrP1_001489 [[Pythium] brassicae (nom. inval.)]|nr:hypothetical protein PybrP1_001489 [[Pythium] brassicae (nom. inval.)]